MATTKQINLILRLFLKTGKTHDFIMQTRGIARDKITKKDIVDIENEMRTKLEPWSTKQASMKIDELNEELGWDRAYTPATNEQRMYIGDLEIKIFGGKRTRSTQPLTYAEADKLIKYYRSDIKTPVVAKEAPKNVDWDSALATLLNTEVK